MYVIDDLQWINWLLYMFIFYEGFMQPNTAYKPHRIALQLDRAFI